MILEYIALLMWMVRSSVVPHKMTGHPAARGPISNCRERETETKIVVELQLTSIYRWAASMLSFEKSLAAQRNEEYHPTRVFTLVYQPFAPTTIAIPAYNEAKINTRLRFLIRYTIFFLNSLLVLVEGTWRMKGDTPRRAKVDLEGGFKAKCCRFEELHCRDLDLTTSGKGGIGTFVGVCALRGAFGVADAYAQGGMIGDLSFMILELIQSLSAGMAASDAITSALRLITKAAFESSKGGLRKGAISAVFELLCVLLYAYVFPEYPIVKYYRAKAASEGSTAVSADLAIGGVQMAT
ncbi:hypothetical protein ACLOJK_039779 [Asimina triloba]